MVDAIHNALLVCLDSIRFGLFLGTTSLLLQLRQILELLDPIFFGQESYPLSAALRSQPCLFFLDNVMRVSSSATMS